MPWRVHLSYVAWQVVGVYSMALLSTTALGLTIAEGGTILQLVVAVCAFCVFLVHFGMIYGNIKALDKRQAALEEWKLRDLPRAYVSRDVFDALTKQVDDVESTMERRRDLSCFDTGCAVRKSHN